MIWLGSSLAPPSSSSSANNGNVFWEDPNKATTSVKSNAQQNGTTKQIAKTESNLFIVPKTVNKISSK